MKRTRKRQSIPIKVAGGPTPEQLTELLSDLHAISEAHPELYYRVYELIGWLLLPGGFIWQQQANRESIRHRVARYHLEHDEPWDSASGSAFETASNNLIDHPAAAGPDRIGAAYKAGERNLPPELRRVRS